MRSPSSPFAICLHIGPKLLEELPVPPPHILSSHVDSTSASVSAGTNVDSGFFTSLEPNSTLAAADAVVPKPADADASDGALNDEKLAVSAVWKDAKPPPLPLAANAPKPPVPLDAAGFAANAAKPLEPLNATKPPNALPVVFGVDTALDASSVDSKPWIRLYHRPLVSEPHAHTGRSTLRLSQCAHVVLRRRSVAVRVVVFRALLCTRILVVGRVTCCGVRALAFFLVLQHTPA